MRYFGLFAICCLLAGCGGNPTHSGPTEKEVFIPEIECQRRQPDLVSEKALNALEERRYGEAIARYQCLTMILENSDPGSMNLAESYNYLGTAYASAGQLSKAEPFFKKSLEMKEEKFGINSVKLASEVSNMARLYHSRADFVKAEAYYRRAITISENEYGPHSEKVNERIQNLANMYHDAKREDEAKVLEERIRKNRIYAEG